MKILVIDDNPEMKPLMEMAADIEGSTEIEVLENGLNAVAYLDEHEADAVLVDLAMPAFDGISTVQEIRRNEQIHPNREPVHLAFFTAHIIDNVVREVMKDNTVEKVFRKPCDPVELIQSVKEWIGAGRS